MKLITRKQVAEIFQQGKKAGRYEEQQLQNLYRRRLFCNTGCRATKCLRTPPTKQSKL